MDDELKLCSGSESLALLLESIILRLVRFGLAIFLLILGWCSSDAGVISSWAVAVSLDMFVVILLAEGVIFPCPAASLGLT